MGKLNNRDLTNNNDHHDGHHHVNKRARYLNSLEDDLISSASANNNNGTDNGGSKIDWQQLIGSFKNKNVQEIIENLISNLCGCENTEFDQMCLILKHYLISDERNEEFLMHFLKYDNCSYVNKLIVKFNLSDQQPNLQWMISELFKIVTSISNLDQVNLFMSSNLFVNFMFASIFNANILARLAAESGISAVEMAILVNILESIVCLCEIKSELVNQLLATSSTHVDWLAKALLSKKNSADLNISIAKVMNLLSAESNSKRMIELFFVTEESFLKTSIEFLSKQNHNHHHQTTESLISNNLNAKLYLIASYVNMLLNESGNSMLDALNLNKVQHLLGIVCEYGALIEHSLSIKLNEKDLNSVLLNHGGSSIGGRQEDQQKSISAAANEDESDDDHSKARQLIKLTEQSIECKLLGIDLFRTICSYFKTDGDEDDDSNEEWEEINSDDEDGANRLGNQNDAEMENSDGGMVAAVKVEPNQMENFKQMIMTTNLKMMPALVATICQDDETVLQNNERERIVHVYNSIKLIRNEALQSFIQTFEMIKEQNQTAPTFVDVNWLIDLLRLMETKSSDDLRLFTNKTAAADENNNEDDEEENNDDNEILTKLCQIVHDLFCYLNGLQEEAPVAQLSLERLDAIVNSIKNIFFKYKTSSTELCIRLGRILTLLAIRLRDKTSINETGPLLQLCATILIELTTATFDLMDQSRIETLKLNAELLDFLIDLFSEDSLTLLEKELSFVDRMKYYSEKFYAKCKKFKNKNRLEKNDCVLIKTVKDNLKPFVQYKLKANN